MSFDLEDRTAIVTGTAKGQTRELVPSNFTVNCIAPSMIRAEFLAELSDAYIDERTQLTPMKRLCAPKEIADMTAWVVRPHCSFTTGHVFDVSAC
ncbi:MAG: SDR family oxidoreductase [Paracoccaceae bacterium]|nr:SDR family oxidoreductase [Paracoccaceae bacterium]MDE2911323.1 SDR family oxidoreductase [Paracoccaceae bacterium]